jgi:hypothetical protein
MNNNRKRILLAKQNNFVKVTTVKLFESCIPFSKALEYLKQGYTTRDLIKGIKVQLEGAESYFVIDKYQGLSADLCKLYKEEMKLNSIEITNGLGKLTPIGVTVRNNERNQVDKISMEIQSIFRSNRELRNMAY